MWTNYPWEIKEGLTLNHSFDRVYYHATIENHDEMLDERNKTFKEFEKTTKTRLVFNVIIRSDIEIENNEFAPGEVEAHFPFPKWTVHEWYKNVIIWYNKEVRSINNDQKKQIQKKVFEILNKGFKTIEKTETTKQDLLETLDDEAIFNENIKKIKKIKEEWYTYNMNPNAEKLAILWKDTFGWNVEKVRKELETWRDLILSLEDKDWNIISAWMLAESWESTEWVTNPNFQGKGMIQPLLFVLHSYWIKKMKKRWTIYPITAEARFDRSVSPGKKIWMKIYWVNINKWLINTEEDIWVHQNHVTIWWECNLDSRNKEKEENINWLNFKELRSFVTMILPEYYYQNEKIEEVLKIANM